MVSHSVRQFLTFITLLLALYCYDNDINYSDNYNVNTTNDNNNNNNNNSDNNNNNNDDNKQ